MILDAIVLGSIYSLFALGLTLCWGVLNVLNLAHGAIFMFSALVVYVLTKSSPLSILVVIVAGMATGGVLAVLIDVVAFRRIRRRLPDPRDAELAMMIASVGASAVLIAIAQDVTDNQIVAINAETYEVRTLHVLGLAITNIELIIIGCAAIASVALALFVQRTQTGRALRALSFDARTCALLGISANRLAFATLFVSGALAGLAGVLLGIHLSAVDAEMGQDLMLKAFAVIILGGIGSVWGATAGAFILAFAETIVVTYSTGVVRDGVSFALIIAILLIRPQGLFARRAYQRA
jgi:branched-chain amino acid transport system permease protein